MVAQASPRGRFGRRLAVVILVLVIAPLLAVGWRLIGVNQDALEDANRDLLFSVLDDVGHTLDATVTQSSAGLVAIRQALTNDQASSAERKAHLTELVAVLPGLTVVGLYDERGVRFNVARRVGDTTPLPDALPPALLAAAAADGTAIGEVTRGPAGPSVPMVAQIKLPEATWYAYTAISLAPLDTRVAEVARDRFGDDLDSVFVVDAKLRVISHPDPERAQAMVDVSQSGLFAHLPPGSLDQPVALLEYATYPSPAGEMVGAVRRLPSSTFAVVAQLPRARVFASIARMRLIVVVVIGIAALLAAIAALVLARQLSAPIRRLVAFAHRLAAREFTAVADVHTGDELEVLGAAMTDAAQALAASDAKLVEETSIRSDLGRYLPAQLVDKVVRREQSLQLGGHRRTVTVLFADVASFTRLTENHPPDVVVTILNQLFTILTEIVFRHGGTVDKFIGDCVMAFWNAPDDQPDHAARALAAATDMLRWLEIGNEAWQAKHGVTIHLAIGVNTGEVVVGNFGSESRMTYTCIGDSVNVAARLEGIARPQQILASRATRDAAPGALDYISLGAQRLPGRLEPVDVYEVNL